MEKWKNNEGNDLEWKNGRIMKEIVRNGGIWKYDKGNELEWGNDKKIDKYGS